MVVKHIVRERKEKQMLEIHIKISLEIERCVLDLKGKEKALIIIQLIFFVSRTFSSLFPYVFLCMSIDHPLSMSLSNNLKNLGDLRLERKFILIQVHSNALGFLACLSKFPPNDVDDDGIISFHCGHQMDIP